MKIIRFLIYGVVGIIVFAMLFVLSLYFITIGDYSVPKTVAQDSSIPHIKINNTIFHAETFGDSTKQAVIVVHGGPGNDYRSLLPLKALSKDYFVIFYDQRGTGLSPRVPEEEQSAENAVMDLKNIINYYSPDKKINIIGHSWGAMVATSYLAQNPEKVNKIVLAEPGMLTSEQASRFFEIFQIDMGWDFYKSLLFIAFESLHLDVEDKQARMDYIFSKLAMSDIEGNPMRKYFCNEDMHNGYVPFWRYSYVASQAIVAKKTNEFGELEIDLVSGLENYNDKVLFLVGECNQLIGEEFQKDHIKYFQNAEMKIIPNAGHTMLGEKPEECIPIIEEYFEEGIAANDSLNIDLNMK
jgi:proline iminopeptidase